MMFYVKGAVDLVWTVDVAPVGPVKLVTRARVHRKRWLLPHGQFSKMPLFKEN